MSLTRLSVYLSMPRRRAMILPTKMPEAGALMAMMAKPIKVAHLQDKRSGKLSGGSDMGSGKQGKLCEWLGGQHFGHMHGVRCSLLLQSPGLGRSRQQSRCSSVGW